jgi:uncharacterized protein YpmB
MTLGEPSAPGKRYKWKTTNLWITEDDSKIQRKKISQIISTDREE